MQFLSIGKGLEMDSVSARGLITVAAIQAAVAAAALLASSPSAAVIAASIGLLAVGRYASIAFFAAGMSPGPASKYRAVAASAWIIGFLALVAAVAAVALRLREALPWAVAAAFAGPMTMSVLALASGIGSLAANSRAAAARREPRAGGAR
jgi:hypothetical protein